MVVVVPWGYGILLHVVHCSRLSYLPSTLFFCCCLCMSGVLLFPSCKIPLQPLLQPVSLSHPHSCLGSSSFNSLFPPWCHFQEKFVSLNLASYLPWVSEADMPSLSVIVCKVNTLHQISSTANRLITRGRDQRTMTLKKGNKNFLKKCLFLRLHLCMNWAKDARELKDRRM